MWHEACRFEHRCNHLHEALHVAEQGLLQLPRYGPLWFCALRLQECTLTLTPTLTLTLKRTFTLALTLKRTFTLALTLTTNLYPSTHSTS